jgi:hypothetical protein
MRLAKETTCCCRGDADPDLVAVTVTLVRTTWDKSLMFLDDGALFVPLEARVRKREYVQQGGKIRQSFTRRSC